jgi:lysine-N-methylase
MTFPIRQLPVIQNWSCHSCGNCCKMYYVTVTDEERRRIDRQGWSELPEFQGQPLFVPYGPWWRREWRLSHREDGSCIFLDECGLCRIHAKFGEPAKPIACQLYPYMLVPAGKELRVSVRFSCPSAVKNLGRPVKEQADTIRHYARQLVPPNARPSEPPPLRPGQCVDWPRLLDVVAVLERLIAGGPAELPQRLIRALVFTRLLEQARVAKLDDGQFRELLTILEDACNADAPTSVLAQDCTGWALMLFRLIVAQCARRDVSPHLRRGVRGRWLLFRAATRFARGRGAIPQLQPIFGNVEFAAVEKSFGPLPAEAASILERYYRIKLSGIQFFGSPFFQVPLVEGLYGLALTFPAILWISRWLAAGAGRTTLSADDVAAALAVVDHQWGFAAAFGFAYSRWRVRLLASQGQIEKLIALYSQ